MTKINKSLDLYLRFKGEETDSIAEALRLAKESDLTQTEIFRQGLRSLGYLQKKLDTKK